MNAYREMSSSPALNPQEWANSQKFYLLGIEKKCCLDLFRKVIYYIPCVRGEESIFKKIFICLEFNEMVRPTQNCNVHQSSSSLGGIGSVGSSSKTFIC